ncbi:hypothetical protein NDU88_004296 [Pleurodeles waltl]|uniref:Uncharacterized protein n=1 Tax=Pleurodeles waltl TaxID=8319 RepID=A0AAV7PCD3_PLEWA|nr:hypothetical protein NDU88_004296 [Pleurodeles waltl]
MQTGPAHPVEREATQRQRPPWTTGIKRPASLQSTSPLPLDGSPPSSSPGWWVPTLEGSYSDCVFLKDNSQVQR